MKTILDVLSVVYGLSLIALVCSLIYTVFYFIIPVLKEHLPNEPWRDSIRRRPDDDF